MNETRNILMNRKIYFSFSEKNRLVSSEERGMCVFTRTVQHVVKVVEHFVYSDN